MPDPTRLLGGAEEPFLTELCGYFFVRDGAASGDVSAAPLNDLNDVEVIQHVVERAVVGEAFEECADGVFGFHSGLGRRCPSSIVVWPQTCSDEGGRANKRLP